MKRLEVDAYAFMGTIIQKGLSSDDLLEIMPRVIMTADPKVVDTTEDGLVVEWHYPDVVFTFARILGANPFSGLLIKAYGIIKIEQYTKEEKDGV